MSSSLFVLYHREFGLNILTTCELAEQEVVGLDTVVDVNPLVPYCWLRAEEALALNLKIYSHLLGIKHLQVN